MAERDTNKQEKWFGINDYENPPVKGAVLKDGWWCLPLKGTDPAAGLVEKIVAVATNSTPPPVDATEANIVVVGFLPKSDGTDYVQGDTLRVAINYNENVDVTAGATLVVSTTGAAVSFVATAAVHTGVGEIIFEATIPAETGDLTIDTQTVIGTITDSSDATVSDKVISVDVAAGAEAVIIA